jgi:cell volume regulation protein A
VQTWPSVELRLKGTTKIEDVHHSYGLRLTAAAEECREAVVLKNLEQAPAIDARVALGGATLRVCEVVGTRLATIGGAAETVVDAEE